MNLPKFLMADSSAHPDDVYVLHTDYPRFILNINTEEVEWFDDVQSDDSKDFVEIVQSLISEAFAFFESEISHYDQED